jgi:hypothetical protein
MASSLYNVSKMGNSLRSRIPEIEIGRVRDPFDAGTLERYVFKHGITPKKLVLTVPYSPERNVPDPGHRLRGHRIKLEGGARLSTGGMEPELRTWTGPSVRDAANRQGNQIEWLSMTLVWKLERGL